MNFFDDLKLTYIKTISSFKVVGVHFTKQISVTFCSYLYLLHFSASRARA